MDPFAPCVLIVEDDFIMRYVLGRLIRLAGRRTIGASTVAAGISLLDSGPECVVLDLNLPDGDGEAMLHAVRVQCPACRVVVCTGSADYERLERLTDLGADAVLIKPILVDEFIDACCPRSAAV